MVYSVLTLKRAGINEDHIELHVYVHVESDIPVGNSDLSMTSLNYSVVNLLHAYSIACE